MFDSISLRLLFVNDYFLSLTPHFSGAASPISECNLNPWHGS